MNMQRSLYFIAQEIKNEWRDMSPAAAPYVHALLYVRYMDDRYGGETGVSLVSYFLANAQTWTGERARAIKGELRVMLKQYNEQIDKGVNDYE